MMRKPLSVAIALLGAAALIAEKPAGLSTYTWAREDLFAGPMGNDLERFSAGMRKVDEILQANPKQPDALALKGFGTAYLAFRSLDAGDRAGFDRQWDEGIRLMEQAAAIAPTNGGVNSVYGATMLFWFSKLPAERRQHAAEKGRSNYLALYKQQEKMADQMPVHFKGELFAGLAEAERRSGNMEQAKIYLKRLIDTTPGSPYARVASRWLENPDKIPESSRLMCQTCHEPGRLDNVLASRSKQ